MKPRWIKPNEIWNGMYFHTLPKSNFPNLMQQSWTNGKNISELQLQKKNSQNRTSLAVTTKQNIYGELRNLFNYAVEKEYLLRNPLHNVKNFKDPYEINPQEKLQYYIADEFKQYIVCAKQLAEESGSLTDWGDIMYFSILHSIPVFEKGK